MTGKKKEHTDVRHSTGCSAYHTSTELL